MISYISGPEKELIEALKEVQYGELLDVELGDSGQPPNLQVDLTRQTQELVKLIQDGVRFFHIIRVHQGEPTLAEAPYTTISGRFRCKKQYKFNH